jgi:hypothetical protein
MSNTPGRVGREGEHKTIELLEAAGFNHLIREGKRATKLDIISDPELVPPEDRLKVPVESRRRKRIQLQAWVRDLFSYYQGLPWSLFIHPRDARVKDHMPPVMVVPAGFGAHLLKLHHDHMRKGVAA